MIEQMWQIYDEEKAKGPGFSKRTADRLGWTDGQLRGHMGRNPRRSETDELVASQAKKIATQASTIAGLRAEKRATMAELVAAGDIFKAIEDNVIPISTKPLIPRTASRHDRPQDLCLLLGDWHGGKVITREMTNGFNEFNMHILACRMDLLTDKVISLIIDEQQQHNIQRIVVVLLGDMINGGIHEGDGGRNETDEATAAIWVGDLQAQMGERFAQYLPVEFRDVRGNHARFGEKMTSSRPDASWDGVASHCARARLKGYMEDGRIVWPVNHAWTTTVELQGHKFLATHGQEIKTTLSVPWPGASRAFKNRQEAELMKTDKGIHMILFGHHHRSAHERRVFIANGSPVGIDGYGEISGFTPVEPIQVGFKVDRERGVDNIYEFELSDAPEEHSFDLPDTSG